MACSFLPNGNGWTNVRGLFKALRPAQLTKNVIIYTALVFDGKLRQPELVLSTTLLVLAFCLATTSGYLLDDWLASRKARQALASGQHGPSVVILGTVIFAILSLCLSTWLNGKVGLLTALYLLLQVSYSCYFKHIVLIDVMSGALGMVVQVFTGAVLVQVDQFSPWLYVCVMLLALFVGFGRWRAEMTQPKVVVDSAGASLVQDTLALLDQITLLVTASILVAYTLYTFGASTALVNGGRLLLTVPFVFYFMTRYLYLIHVKKLSGAPDELLWQDKPLLLNSLLWVVAVGGLLYL